MKRRLRAGCLTAALLFAFAFVQTASAETTSTESTGMTDSGTAEIAPSEKTYTIVKENNTYAIDEEPEEAAFWEYPALPAGQQREGTLKVVNQTDNAEECSLVSIDLPYTEEEALTYLAALHITVSQSGGQVLYDGPYSGIADDNGLKISQLPLQPGETAEYHITLRCAFNYGGVPSQATSRITWRVKATSSSMVTNHVIGGTAKIVLVVVVLVLLGAGAALFVFQRKRNRK